MKYNEILNIIPGEICVIRTENGVVKKYVKRQPNKFVSMIKGIAGNKKEVIYERV